MYQDEKPERTLEERSRSQSAPNLTKWPILEKIPRKIEPTSSEDEEETRMQFEKYKLKRRKALSENLFKHSQLRVRSDSDLTKIDKAATFNTVSNIERGELLARVVDAFETTYSRSTSSSSLHYSDDEYEEQPPQKKVNICPMVREQVSHSNAHSSQVRKIVHIFKSIINFRRQGSKRSSAVYTVSRTRKSSPVNRTSRIMNGKW